MIYHQLLFLIFSSLVLISAIFVIISKNSIYSIFFLISVFINSTCLFIILQVDFIALMFLIVYVGAIAVLFLFVIMMINVREYKNINQNFIIKFFINFLISLVFFFEILLVLLNKLTSNIVNLDFFNKFQNKKNYLFESEIIHIFLVIYEHLMLKPLKIPYFNNRLNNEYFLFLMTQYHSLMYQYPSLLLKEFSLYNNIEYINYLNLIDSNNNLQALGQVLYTYYFFYLIIITLILLVATIGPTVLTFHIQEFIKRQHIFEQNSRKKNLAFFKIKI